MKKIICLMASAFVLSAPVNAQLVCGTDAVYNKLKAENPAISALEATLNAEIKETIAKKYALGALGKTTVSTFDIPVVIHVVHDFGGEYLSDDAIFEAVAFWDKVYNAENADTADVITRFKKDIGNAHIRLRLATIDPSGKPTKGIVRHRSYMTTRGSDNAKIEAWPNNQYINIWMVNKFDDDHAGAAAYAYYPGTISAQYDGIIGLASYLNTDKTYPHELGHSFNLAHTWGSTNNPGIACGDDLVGDTPPTMGHTSCNLYDVTCSAPDTNNVQNIMEYAYCSKMFTKGQVDRMQAALSSPVGGRNNLSSSANLVATGALASRPDLSATPDFSIERAVKSWGGLTLERGYFLCQNSGTKFAFRNRSWNDTIVSALWTFSNNASTPTSPAIDGNVTTNFNDAGWATVTLAVTGNNTATQTISKQAVYVASNVAYKGSYAQYFTGPSDFTNWPMFNYFDNKFKWEYNATNGFPDGSGCVRFRSFDTRSTTERNYENPDGDYDDMFTPAFDINSIESPSSTVNLNFYTSGAITNSRNRDSLQIFASVNCGDDWVRIASLSGSGLFNNGSMASEFSPTNINQWKGQTIAIPAAQRTEKTFFRFRYFSSTGGNNLYFDNFSISPWTTEIKDVAQNSNEVKVFPNPTSGNTKLCFTTGMSGEASYIIRDVTGKIIAQKTLKLQPNTFIQEEINRSELPASGVYLITLTQSEQTITQKLIVE